MTLPDLLAALTEIAERVNHADRFTIFEAMKRLRHEGGYVVTVEGFAGLPEHLHPTAKFAPPTPEMERFWGIR